MIEISIVSPGEFAKYELVRAFLRLRREIFIDQMSWPLYAYGEIEFEQYDTFNSVYIVAHVNGDVQGGARLIRTDWTIGSTGKIRYTYMIKDACDGILEGLPPNLCFQRPPTDPAVWELTRFATLPRKDVGRRILQAANDFLRNDGASRCLFLGPPAFLRMAKSMGYQPQKLGPVVKNADGAFLAFSCDVN